MKLNFIGTIFGSTGYDSHCRQLVNALYELNSDIKLDVPKPPEWQRLVNDAELNMLTKTDSNKDRISIMVATPPYWRLALADNPKHFIGFVVWEGDKVPDYWIPHLSDERVDQIWTPSEHTKQAIIKTYFKDQKTNENNYPYQMGKDESKFVNKIKIVPHGVDLNTFKPNSQPHDKFTFICNKGWRGHNWDRGGVQFLLKAYCEEFTREENVQLILKLNPQYLPPGFDFGKALEQMKLKNKPIIQVNSSILPYNMLPSIYSLADVYVCAQMADAFNIPGLEAMACGLPTIQTNYGGQTDYVTTGSKGNGWLIDYKLVSVQQDIMYEECKWAKPNIDKLRKIMRFCFENPEVVKQRSKQSLEDAKKWTWTNSAKKAIKFLKELK